MVVHVGGKRTHGRFLLLRQRIEFPGDKPKENNTRDNLQNQRVSTNGNGEANGKIDDEMIDLNANPQRVHEPSSNNNVYESLYPTYSQSLFLYSQFECFSMSRGLM
jgi:hypothetical protein